MYSGAKWINCFGALSGPVQQMSKISKHFFFREIENGREVGYAMEKCGLNII
jgi:hypothetical protein